MNTTQNASERWETICELKSITKAANKLGIKRTTLNKWYHMHRNEFPVTIQESIRGNTGRYPQPPRIYTGQEAWALRRPTKEDQEEVQEVGLRNPADFVDAVFLRFQQLKDGYETLTIENRKLKDEVARLKGKISSEADVREGASKMRMQALLAEVAENSRGGN